MDEGEQRAVALQMIIHDLGRLARQAYANGLPLTGYMLEQAQAQASDELSQLDAEK
jgi:hypothetical protein